MSRASAVDAASILDKHGPLTAADFGALTGVRNPQRSLKRDPKVKRTPRGEGVALYYLDGPEAKAQIAAARAERRVRRSLSCGPQEPDEKMQRRQALRRQRLEAYAARLDRPCFSDEIPRRMGEIEYMGRTRKIKTRAGFHNLLNRMREEKMLGVLDVMVDARGGVRLLYFNATNPDSRALAHAWAKEAREKITRNLHGLTMQPPPNMLGAMG